MVGDVLAKFRRDLKVFQTCRDSHAHARLGSPWGFIEHRFVRNDRVIGVVAVRGVFKGPGGPLDPGTLLTGLAVAARSPELPEWTKSFQQSSELLSELLREEERSKAI